MKDITLESIAFQLEELKALMLQNKTVLTFDEACKYSGFSRSYMYKISAIVPFSKPNGKTLFISKKALDEWLLSNPSKSGEQKDKEAATYVSSNKKSK